MHAAANDTPYSGGDVRIDYKPTPTDETAVVYGVNNENEGKFTLVYPEDKYLIPSEGNLVFSSTPPADEHTHGVDGGEGDIVWTKWDGTTNLTAGNYYIENNITLSKTINVSGAVNLCLNGKTISYSGSSSTGKKHVFSVNGTFSVCDCKGGGEIQQLSNSAASYYTIEVKAYATFNLYGGTITAEGNSVAVHTVQPGTINVYGGSIEGTTYRGAITSNGGEVTIAGGTVSGTRSGGALGVSGGTATITGGTVNGVKLQNRAELYLGGAPDVGTVSMAKSGTAKGYDNQIFAAADGTAYAGDKITLTSDDDNIPENTVIVRSVNDDNKGLFELTDYALEKSGDNLVIKAASAIELSVTVPSGLTYGDTKPLTITVEPADAALEFAFAGQPPNDNGSDKFSVTKGSDGTYSLYAGAVGNFILIRVPERREHSSRRC